MRAVARDQVMHAGLAAGVGSRRCEEDRLGGVTGALQGRVRTGESGVGGERFSEPPSHPPERLGEGASDLGERGTS